MSYRKKLIEVALPLDDVNREAAREKSIRVVGTTSADTPIVETFRKYYTFCYTYFNTSIVS